MECYPKLLDTEYKMNILHLPQDVTLQIFSFLSPKDLINSVRRSCKIWNALSYDRSLWKYISLSSIGWHNTFSTSTFLEFLGGICNCVCSLDLGRVNLDSEGYLHENIFCSNLRDLNLFGSDISGDCIIALLEKYKNLHSVSLSLGIASTRMFIGIVKQLSLLEKLESLTVHNCNIDEHSSDLLSEFCQIFKRQSMKNISFIHCDLPDDVYRDILQSNTDLSELNMMLCSPMCCSIFDNCSSLKRLWKLNLTDTKCDDSVLISVSNKSPYLRYVSITSCGSFVTDTGISHMAERCTLITTLIISRSRYDKSSITNVGLAAIADSCKHLRTLVVNYCSEISDSGVLVIARGCRNLQEFEIAGCTALSDRAILCLVENCLGLRKLKLTECVQLTSLSINAVIANLKHLKYLNLETCHRIANLNLVKNIVEAKCYLKDPTDSTSSAPFTSEENSKLTGGLRFISRNESPTASYVDYNAREINGTGEKSDNDPMTISRSKSGIERQLKLHSHLFNLYLGFCSKISDNCLREIAYFCPDLRGLTLQGCTSLTDMAVEELVKSCPALTRLNISGGSVNQTSKLTDRSLHAIANECQNISHLVVCKNPNITIDGLCEVIKRCPKLRLASVSIGDRTNIGISTLTASFSQLESKLTRIEKFGSNRVDIHVYLNRSTLTVDSQCHTTYG